MVLFYLRQEFFFLNYKCFFSSFTPLRNNTFKCLQSNYRGGTLNAESPDIASFIRLTNDFYKSFGYPNHYYMLKYSHEMLIKMKKFK